MAQVLAGAAAVTQPGAWGDLRVRWATVDATCRQLTVRGHNEMPGNATSCPGKFWPWKGVR